MRSSRTPHGLAHIFLVLSLAGSAQADQVGTLTQELSLARKAGLPTTPRELKRKRVPPGQNAAPLYRRFNKLRASANGADLEISKGSFLGRVRPTSDQIAKVRRELNERRNEMSLIHQAVARPACDFGRNWALGASLLFPEFAALREAARRLTAEGGLLLWDGKPLEAVECVAKGFRLAAHAQSDGVYISHLVAIAIDAITNRALQNILYHAGSDPRVADSVLKAIDREWRPRSLADCFGTELVLSLVSFEQIRKGGLGALRAMTSGDDEPAEPSSNSMTPAQKRELDRTVDYSAAFLVRAVRRLHRAADKPYPTARVTFEAVTGELDNVKDPRLALAVVMAPVYSRLFEKRAQDTALILVTRCAAAALAYKARAGRFPKSLQAALSSNPIDPFDLKPLRYRAVGEGFVVWSVGTSGKFAGNATNMRDYNREAVFRWPIPAFLTEPPK